MVKKFFDIKNRAIYCGEESTIMFLRIEFLNAFSIKDYSEKSENWYVNNSNKDIYK